MLSRKVVTRSGRGFRGHFPSKKLNRLVQFESLLERDAIRLFENAAEVLSFQEQPAIIYYYLDDAPHRYYPDFELNLANEIVVHAEIKPSIHLATVKLSAKYSAIAKAYLGRSEHFVVLTEKELRHTPKDFYEMLYQGHENLFTGGSHAEILL